MKVLHSLIILCICFSTQLKADETEKPNIIFFFIDDMGWKDWSGGGHDYYETPNIDSIAKNGVVFKQGYVNAANCAPSRCAVISGQYPPRNHFYNVWTIHRGRKGVDRLSLKDVTDKQILLEERVTFAEALKTAGYKTAMYGKWHVHGGIKTQGFDEVDEHFAPKLKALYKKDKDPKHMYSYTKQSIAFVEKCTKEKKPFMIYIWLTMQFTDQQFIAKSEQKNIKVNRLER